MNRPLLDAVREHFGKVSLSQDQLKELESLIADNTMPTNRGWRERRRLFGWAAVVAVTVLLAVTTLFAIQRFDSIPMAEQIAMEVARNQIKLKPLDIETGSFENIRAYFTDLDFLPVESSLLADAHHRLLGGRYCSIQSVPAAQLRIEPRQGEPPQTLYETEYRRDVFGPLPVVENGDMPVVINTKGVRVSIWVEKGLLFALTEDARTEPFLGSR